jgi:hypothetical protein
MEDSEFWTAREALKHIHENSTSNFASPWHILALAIEGALQQVPYGTKVQTHRIYGLVPNFASILYGRSGGGKSSAQDLVHRLFEWEKPYRPHGVRSGEGIIDSYGTWTSVADAKVFVWNDEDRASAFVFDEITDFSAKADRSGSTMVGTVLSMVTGDTIGGVRAGGNDSTLYKGTYRATLSIGGQPGRCESLVSADAVARGVAGRFLWVRSDVKRPEIAPTRRTQATVNAMTIGTQDWPEVIPTDGQVLDQTHEFDQEYRYDDSTIEKIDGHKSMNTLKVATALAVLDGRANVSLDDWTLAQYVMERSDETRAEAIEAQFSAVMERAEEKGVEKAMTTRAENVFVQRVGEYVARALEKGFQPGARPSGEEWKKFRGLFNSKVRGVYMDAVVKELGWGE